MKSPLQVFEKGFTVASLVLYSGGPFTVILSGGLSQGDTDVIAEPDFAIVRLMFLLTYAVFFVLLALRWKHSLFVLSQDRFIFPLIGLVFASYLWSEVPSATLGRGIALLGTSLFGLYLASRYSLKQQVELLSWAFGIVILLSFIYVGVLPRYGIMGGVHAGAWRGIYSHKNMLGKMMVLSTITFLLLSTDANKRRWAILGGLGLSFLLLVASSSKTALVIATTLVLSMPLYRILRARDDVLIPTVLIGVILVGGTSALLVTNAEVIVTYLGRDLTLTGRTDLWLYSLEMIEQRLWLGHGYDAFWQGWDSSAAYIWRAVGWPAPHSHNGLVDLGLDLGLVGVACFTFGLLASFYRSLIWLRLNKSLEALYPLLYLITFVLLNVNESDLLVRNSILWVLYTGSTLSLAVSLRKKSKKLVEAHC